VDRGVDVVEVDDELAELILGGPAISARFAIKPARTWGSDHRFYSLEAEPREGNLVKGPVRFHASPSEGAHVVWIANLPHRGGPVLSPLVAPRPEGFFFAQFHVRGS